jgi:hypothetical protein
MDRNRALVGGVLAVALIATLLYLRDPPWLLSTTSGLRGWEDDGATRFRWMGGHASLFVPASARSIEIPLRTTFKQPGDWPITVRVSIDDRLSDQLVLGDAGWHSIVLRMPPPGSRKVRRVDIRVDRTRDDNYGAAVGEIGIR